MNLKEQNCLTPNLKGNINLKSGYIIKKRMLSPPYSIIPLPKESKEIEPQSLIDKVWEDMASLLDSQQKNNPKSSPNSPSKQLPIFKKILEKNQINEEKKEPGFVKENSFSRTSTDKDIENNSAKKSVLTFESETK